MKILVESLKRLYAAQKVTEEKLEEMRQKGTISEEEVNFIKEV